MIDLKNIKVINKNEELPCLGKINTIVLIYVGENNPRIITTTDVFENTSLTWIEAFQLGIFKHCEYNDGEFNATTPDDMKYFWNELLYQGTEQPGRIILTDPISKYLSYGLDGTLLIAGIQGGK